MSSLRDKRYCRTDGAKPIVAARPADIVIGRFVGLAEDGAPLVDFVGNPTGAPIRALATARFDLIALNAPVALLFLNGDPAHPIAIGVIVQSDGDTAACADPHPASERVVVRAGGELVLQCGHASLTLTSAGKVLLRGTYVSSRSSGLQRITGAQVQIN
jgi:hypothetical protein